MKNKKPPLELYSDILDRLMLYSSATKKNAFLVTSAADNEGKTTTAINMASALANKGKKTILINADFKKPTNGFFSCETGTSGLADVCSADCCTENLIVPNTEIPHLWLVPCGILKQDSLGLFLSNEFRSFIENLKDSFEFIIIDSCSINKNVDPLVLSQYSDGIIFVILSDKTRAGEISAARDKLLNNDCEIVGVVLNKMKKFMYAKI